MSTRFEKTYKINFGLLDHIVFKGKNRKKKVNILELYLFNKRSENIQQIQTQSSQPHIQYYHLS